MMELPTCNKLQLMTLTVASAVLIYISFGDTTLAQVAGIVVATAFLVVVFGQIKLQATRKTVAICIVTAVVVVGVAVVLALKHPQRMEAPAPAAEQAAPGKGITLDEWNKLDGGK